MRILVAEDERDMNRLITRTLEKEGYGVDSCHDGDEALDYLDSADYDAAILDIMMPRRDGYEVLKHLRGLGKETPVLFLTALRTGSPGWIWERMIILSNLLILMNCLPGSGC